MLSRIPNMRSMEISIGIILAALFEIAFVLFLKVYGLAKFGRRKKWGQRTYGSICENNEYVVRDTEVKWSRLIDTITLLSCIWPLGFRFCFLVIEQEPVKRESYDSPYMMSLLP